MTPARLATIGILVLGLALPLTAIAEGSGHPEGTAPDKPVTVKRKLKPKAKPAPSTPAEPIPYDAYSGTGAPTHSPELTHTETPPAPPAPPAATITAAPEPVSPMPAPVIVEAAPVPPPQATISEISLKCDTRVTRNGKLVSAGTFYVNIFPSPVFPDELASFQFRFADPNHESLIRGSMCLDTQCTAKVSQAAYALVDRVTKKGKALRITLDRSQGAFYAEEIEGRRHLGEQGWCTVQTLPSAKF